MLTPDEHAEVKASIDVLKQRLNERIALEENQPHSAKVERLIEAAREALKYFNDRYPTDIVTTLEKARTDLEMASEKSKFTS